MFFPGGGLAVRFYLGFVFRLWFFEAVEYKEKSELGWHFWWKNSFITKFPEIQIPGIRNHPRAGNFAGNPNLITKSSQNHEKLRNLEKHEKHQKTSGFINFSTFKINFRSADAANQSLRGPASTFLICYVSKKGE